MNMKRNTSNEREHWGGSLGFIFAAAGSAIGLGNIWKFPYITGMNGGGVFILVYLFCIFLIGLPIMICEIAIGRHTQKNPLGAFLQLDKNNRLSRSFGTVFLLIGLGFFCFGKYGLGGVFSLIAVIVYYFGWGFVGLGGIFTGFLILAFYGTVGGWVTAYIFKGLFQQLNFETVEEASQVFNNFVASPTSVLPYQIVFMLLCAFVVWFGIKNGIELASKLLLPFLFILLIILILRGITLDGANKGIEFLVSPDFSKLTPEGVLVALGHAFFSLSLGMGCILTYGSYLDPSKNILSSSLNIVFLDTMVALMAGFAIFPAVFAMGMSPDAGPGLALQIMPLTFNSIGDHLGWLWSSLFFLLLSIAAWTSGISLLEVLVTSLIDEFKFSRHQAVMFSTVITTALGVLATVCCTDWSRLPWLEKALVALFGSTNNSMFDLLDNISCNYLLPLGGLGTSIFVGWIWGTHHAIAEIRRGSHQTVDVNFFTLLAGLKDDPNSQEKTHTMTLATVWGIFIRFITPICVIIAFLHAIGWLHFD